MVKLETFMQLQCYLWSMPKIEGGTSTFVFWGVFSQVLFTPILKTEKMRTQRPVLKSGPDQRGSWCIIRT